MSCETKLRAPIVNRPEGYWQALFNKYENGKLKEILHAILNCDMKIFRAMLTTIEYQADVVHFIDPTDVTPKEWVISCTPKQVHVVDVGNAKQILAYWQDFDGLPTSLCDGSEMKVPANFDQLLVLMAQFNPYWLLEVCAYLPMLFGGLQLEAKCISHLRAGRVYEDFSPNPDYNYNATSKEMTQIRIILKQLLASLE